MDVYLSEVLRYLAGQSWQIAALTLAMGVATWALRHRTAHVRYLLWLIVLAKCLVPPLFAVPLRVLPERVVVAPMVAGDYEPEAVDFGAGDRSAETRVSGTFFPPVKKVPDTFTESTESGSFWVGIVWLGGASVYLVFNLLRAVRGQWWLGKRRRRAPDELMREVEGVPAKGGRGVPRVWVVEEVGQPFVWGLVRGSIYLPAGFAAMGSAEQRRQVLAHELSHVQRFDAGVNALQVLAQGVFWFHPLVWWANRKIRQEREKCCDETAVAQLGTKASDYCHAVVETLAYAERSARPIPSLAVAGPVENTKERIKAMLRSGRKFYRRPSPTAMVGIGLMAAMAVSTALVVTGRAATEAKVDDPPTSSERRADKAAEDIIRRDLPEGWSLKYDDGITSDGKGVHWPSEMAHDLVSLEVLAARPESQEDDWKKGTYEFNIVSLDGREVGTIMVRPDLVDKNSGRMMLPNRMVLKPGLYSLRYRRRGGKNPDNFWMHGGPFAVDLSKPGMYRLRFVPKLGRARITGALSGCYALNFARTDVTGVALTGTIYQYPPEQYTIDGIPAGRYRLSAVAQLDGPNVFVSRAEASVADGDALTIDMPTPPRGTCSLAGRLLGKPQEYKTPWPTSPMSPGRWFVLIRDPGSEPIVTTPAYEAQTMDSLYIVRASKIFQESEETALYRIEGIAPGEYTVTAIEHPWFGGCTIERQQSRPLILRAGEAATLDFDLRETSRP